MPASAVEFAAVNFALPSGRLLLADISLSVAAGSTTALLGRSGSGKTTLLRTVNALVMPTSGVVCVHGHDVIGSNPRALRRSIGYVIQETGLFPHMTVARNVGMSLELGDATSAAQTARAKEMLTLVGLSEDIGQRMPRELSGGQRQRAGLARALAGEPQVLLMDEPFGALDPLTRGEMQRMLRELLRRLRKTTLIVTHDLNEALFLADRIVLLEAGRIVADLAIDDVAHTTNAAMQSYIRASQPQAIEVRRV